MNPISIRRLLVVIAVAALLVVSPSRADDYPSRAITIVVPFPPGGSSDIVMRLVASTASEILKQTIVIENRPGAAGNVAAMAIKNAPPDGYLLMLGHTGTHAINPTLYSDLRFDPIKDFAPITGLVTFNNILNVPTASPAKTVAELATYAKSKPEGLSYGSQGVGTGGHLLGVLFAKHAGITLVHVPYRGVAPAVTDTVAGRVDMLFAGYLSSGSHVEAGRLRLLAIAGSKRHPRLPDVPTTAEAGYPEVRMDQWFGLFAPAKTPAHIVQKLNTEFVKALQSPEVRDKVLSQVFSVMATTPDELGAIVARDIVRLGQVVKDSGAKAPDAR
ncbi:MAG: tripartite tricarboxylate transporter substrate binding protein [Alphaproteobacteria bacterium]|nr:tripartite tricarboxylate transporter substrate binding protein [Alphaproteobacteria bacterium]